ncbi:hypothetical protein [Psychroserpens sp. NJDZ02]|uniref:hypothetical protein n=1 Tax=Psychroserpens sp. NJDZ02 TaxID=2570561 RepID=UPI0010A76363|nr:hypothetical protein [Psychroserpens sp. NJDZ02]QCE42753.1 hypothetical protein E9099_15490 [Psychroserpens sp. NJDZ02]
MPALGNEAVEVLDEKSNMFSVPVLLSLKVNFPLNLTSTNRAFKLYVLALLNTFNFPTSSSSLANK